ncbi:hypothetical protein PsYK624_149220 [Phanerochaete sordida]|uniref:Uncharacterized protein n=1 Tax=Phanerochaete sordida TaxID=48140 RepID=A0A9P3GNE1_9APHY|nr:hypothetical protein PsYK624_149220 [Phanerochaete sordida]
MLEKLYVKIQDGKIPQDLHPHFAHTSLNNLLTVLFGLRTETVDRPLVAHWLKPTQEYTCITAALLTVVDFVPGLRRFWREQASGEHTGCLVSTCSAFMSDDSRHMKDKQDVLDCFVWHLLKAKESLGNLNVVAMCAELMLAAI